MLLSTTRRAFQKTATAHVHHRMQSTTRLEALRKAMSQSTDKIDALYVSLANKLLVRDLLTFALQCHSIRGCTPGQGKVLSCLGHGLLRRACQSEYTAECDNRRAWISGFTGSAGELACKVYKTYLICALSRMCYCHPGYCSNVYRWQILFASVTRIGSKLDIDEARITRCTHLEGISYQSK